MHFYFRFFFLFTINGNKTHSIGQLMEKKRKTDVVFWLCVITWMNETNYSSRCINEIHNKTRKKKKKCVQKLWLKRKLLFYFVLWNCKIKNEMEKKTNKCMKCSNVVFIALWFVCSLFMDVKLVVWCVNVYNFAHKFQPKWNKQWIG